MKFPRCAPAKPVFAAVSALTCLTGAGLAVATAAPRATWKATRTLSFSVTARFDARRAGTSLGQPQQTFSARVWSKGNQARVETRLSDERVVFVYAPPFVYKLLPDAKAGVRYQTPKSGSADSALLNGFNLQGLLHNPAAIRAALQKQGARRTGSGKVNGSGAVADIYTARNFMGKGQNVTVWLRRGDALPLRLEARSASLHSIVSWRDYRRDIALPDALFARPAGYSIRNSQNRPRLL